MEVDDDLSAEIQAQVDEWSSNTNECTHINLIRAATTSPSSTSVTAAFQPEFTYPIFGDEEAIFGYQNLAITLSFAAHNLKPHVSITHGDIFESQGGDVRPTDIRAALVDFLPAEAFVESSSEVALCDPQAAMFRPPGQRIHEYSRHGERFEIWCASLADPAARKLLENIQILVPMFIEGGTILQLEQDWITQRWKVFFLYQLLQEATDSSYSLVGYATSYRVLTLPDRQKPLQSDLDLFNTDSSSLSEVLPFRSMDANPTTPSSNAVKSPLDLPCRERLSQFLILPPFQGNSHGQALYDALYAHLTLPTNVREFTVEDPNEAFDDLRDLCDLLALRRDPAFSSLKINTSIPAAALEGDKPIPTSLIVSGEARENIMRRTKIMARQFDRVVEMHTLSLIPPLHRSRSRITRKEKSSNEFDRAYYFWRLYAKQRLYVFNRDQLIQLEPDERVEKLEAALDSVLEGYVKVLEKVQRREMGTMVEGNGVAEGSGSAPSNHTSAANRPGKRRIIDEAEEDDDEAADDAEDAGDETAEPDVTIRRKKARLDV